MEQVILVDEQDREIGVAEKIRAHQDGGQLHRAFSIFIRNKEGRLLLQRRAAGKYHFGDRWSNTCCGHPRPGETLVQAARRRLKEEFGFDAELRAVATLTYAAHDSGSNLTEREFLHVLTGRFDGPPAPDPDEISDWRWALASDVRRELTAEPAQFTPWFPFVFDHIE